MTEKFNSQETFIFLLQYEFCLFLVKIFAIKISLIYFMKLDNFSKDYYFETSVLMNYLRSINFCSSTLVAGHRILWRAAIKFYLSWKIHFLFTLLGLLDFKLQMVAINFYFNIFCQFSLLNKMPWDNKNTNLIQIQHVQS